MAEIERIDAHTIRLERVLEAPVETVWRHLADADLRARWFAGGPAEPCAGGAIALHFDHDNLSADDIPYPERYAPYQGVVSHEKVVRFEPPHVFAFTFEGPDSGSVATFELAPAGEGRTRLVLTHSGVVDPANAVGYGGGWHSHLAALAEVVTGGQLRDFWAQQAASEAAVKAALA